MVVLASGRRPAREGHGPASIAKVANAQQEYDHQSHTIAARDTQFNRSAVQLRLCGDQKLLHGPCSRAALIEAGQRERQLRLRNRPDALAS